MGQARRPTPSAAGTITTATDLSLAVELSELAVEQGFDRMGVAAAAPLGEEAVRLKAWLARGSHGQMQYMARTAEVRCDPTHPGMLPEARSVIVFARAYGRSDGSQDAAGVARYARGRDYHNVLHRKLRRLTSLLRERGHQARAAVDSMPVFERAWAVRAGLGFIGKNCCLIIPGLGSHVFLSAIVTSAPLASAKPMPERCGSCDRCLRACPTGAFVGERSMDARSCISYLTIEHRGAIDESLRESMGEWLFGCDACQDVCPFNATSPPAAERTQPFAPDVRRMGLAPEDWLGLDEEAFAELAQGSPMRRTRREGMARNAAIVLGNRRERRSLPVLQHSAEQDPSPVVREAAAWALKRIRPLTTTD